MVILPIAGGCALLVPRSYADPQEITIADAMRETACGLSTFRNELAKQRVRTGTFVDQIEVTYNVKASATGTSQLVLDTKATTGLHALTPIGVQYTDKTETMGERGNQIKITMKNILTAQLNQPSAGAISAHPDYLRLADPLATVPLKDSCNPGDLAYDQGKSPSGRIPGWVLDCRPYGTPNVRVMADPSAMTEEWRRNQCGGITTFSRPPM
jgi:hypothetical protein